MAEEIFALTVDQLPGKTLLATKSFFSEFDLRFGDRTIFSLRYKPDLAIEEAHGVTYAGTWNSQHWQVHHFRGYMKERFEVLCNGAILLTASVHNWQLAPRQIDVNTAHGSIRFSQHFFSQSIDDQHNNRIILTATNWSAFGNERELTVNQHADLEIVLPLLIYSLYAGLTTSE